MFQTKVVWLELCVTSTPFIMKSRCYKIIVPFSDAVSIIRHRKETCWSQWARGLACRDLSPNVLALESWLPIALDTWIRVSYSICTNLCCYWNFVIGRYPIRIILINAWKIIQKLILNCDKREGLLLKGRRNKMVRVNWKFCWNGMNRNLLHLICQYQIADRIERNMFSSFADRTYSQMLSPLHAFKFVHLLRTTKEQVRALPKTLHNKVIILLSIFSKQISLA
jgi:hypothetical protein